MQKGEFVSIDYEGTIKETGELFDTTHEQSAKAAGVYNPNFKYGPMTIVVGSNQVLPGVDDKLLEMAEGDEREFDLNPERAFGKRNPGKIKLFQASDFRKQGTLPVVGNTIAFQNGIQGRIISVSSGRVKVDFNHPFAGKSLHYKLKVVRKIVDAGEQASSLITFYLGSKEQFNVKTEAGKALITVPEGKNLPEQLKKILGDQIKKHIPALKDVVFEETKAEKSPTAQ